jgi:hypothetical protein
MGEGMFGRVPKAAQLEKVFQLCYTILGDEDVAFGVTVNCALGVDVEVKEQRARRRYKVDPYGFRQKLIMSRELALQFLAYRLCHKEELAQENMWVEGRGPAPHESYFVSRYIKHILYMTVPHRSFQVAVGLGRLLYDYQKRDIYLVHDSLTQDPRLRKNDQLYKDWKLALMKEFYEHRFEGLLTVKEGKQGSKYFERHGEQERFAGLVENVLKLLAPWGTACALQPGNRSISPFRNFKFKGHPDKEGPFEERRMRAIIDPHCLAVVTEELAIPVPFDRLAVPLFNVSHQPNQIPPVDFDRFPRFTAERLMNLFDEVNENRRRRRKARRPKLSVEVDGVERVSFDPNEQSEVRFTLENGDDLIQVLAPDERGPLLLGSLLLSGCGALDGEEPWKGAIRLEGGQRVDMTITPSLELVGSARGASVAMSYSEGDVLGWLWGSLWGVSDRIQSWMWVTRPSVRARAPLFATIFGIAAAAVLLVATLVHISGLNLAFWRQKEVNKAPTVEGQGETGEVATEVIRPPESTGHDRTGDKASPSSTPTPGPSVVSEPRLVVVDGANTFVLDATGKVSGLSDELPPPYKNALEVALARQQIHVTPLPRELRETSGRMMGGPSDVAPFTLQGPAGEVIATTTPVLKWNSLNGAEGYKVEVYDESYNQVVESEELHKTEWNVPPGRLRHGHTYAWKVTALKEGGNVWSNKPEDVGGRTGRLSEAEFKVMEGSAAAMLRSARGKYKSRLLAAIIYAQSSMPEQAEQELQALLRDNPRSAVVQKLLSELRSQRR